MHGLTRCPTKDRRQITAGILDVSLINVDSSACHAPLHAGLPSKPAGGNSASQRKTDCLFVTRVLAVAPGPTAR
jgi:hypothetical protein